MKKNKLKAAIIGHGFVGKAVDNGFSIQIEKKIIDPKYGNSINDLQSFNPDISFVCVPTPMGENGVQDSSIIENVVKELKEICPETIICIKSTVLPSILKKLLTVNCHLIYNPEFLREKYADEDFENAQFLIFGGKEDIARKAASYYEDHSTCKSNEYVYLDALTASLVKYTINTFLATKVLFLNEIYELFSTYNTKNNWSDFTKALTLDERIGKSHNDVPGPDKKFGFGGACFPKDSSALLAHADEANVSLEVLKAAVKKNNKIRSKYRELDSREIEQNISYDDKI